MRTFCIIVLGLFIFSACDEVPVGPGQGNHLLKNEIIVWNEFTADSIEESWTYLDIRQKFFNDLFGKISKSQILVFFPVFDDTARYPSAWIDVQRNLGIQEIGELESVLKNNVHGFYFEESWGFDTSSVVFTKEVRAWAPVYSALRPDSVQIKKLICLIPCKGNAEQLLAENVIYEVSIYDSAGYHNLDPILFSHLAIDLALSGKANVYDPMDTSKALDAEMLKQKMDAGDKKAMVEGLNGETAMERVIPGSVPYDDILTVVFVEDWYYNTEDFSIRKVVKAIGPVRHYYKEDDQVKTVLFLLSFGPEKFKIF